MKFKKLLLLLSSTVPNSIRIRILRFCGTRIGLDVKNGRGFLVDRAPATHEVGKKARRAAKNTHGPIKVCDGCWIGVTIEEGCIVAAGAVVTKPTESHGLYAGVPARRIKDLPV